MKHRLAFSAVLLLPLSACATTGEEAAYGLYRGGTLGAATGAIIGVATGQGMGKGALAGALLGGAVGAAVAAQDGAEDQGRVVNGVQYYRDTQGRCYYIDQDGTPVYNTAVRC
jgi:uncharacterized protein YcfJ